MRTNFQMEYQSITMTRGDTVSFNVIVKDQDGNLVSADTAFFTCKKLVVDDAFLFQKSIGDGITQYDDCMAVRVAPEDTKYLDAGRYFYDLQIGVKNDVFTILKGVLDIEQNVTF